jgi:RNA polymerase sigma factor (sigma-70 family)
MAATEAGSVASRTVDDLYRQHGGEVYRYAYAVLGNHADAEDVTQTTFLNAYRALEQGVRPRKASNWLLTIASNAIKQRFRQQQARPRQVELDEHIAGSEAADDEGPTIGELLTALSRIPPQQRQAIVLREFEGRSYAEIASILHVTTTALETLLFRARRSLAEELEHQLTCVEAQLAISKAVDGRLGRKERRRLREHLAECPDCAHFARLQPRHRTALRGLMFLPIPLSLSIFRGLDGAGTATAARMPSAGSEGAGAAGTSSGLGGTGAAGGSAIAGGVTIKAAALVAAATLAGGIAAVGAVELGRVVDEAPTAAATGAPSLTLAEHRGASAVRKSLAAPRRAEHASAPSASTRTPGVTGVEPPDRQESASTTETSQGDGTQGAGGSTGTEPTEQGGEPQGNQPQGPSGTEPQGTAPPGAEPPPSQPPSNQPAGTPTGAVQQPPVSSRRHPQPAKTKMTKKQTPGQHHQQAPKPKHEPTPKNEAKPEHPAKPTPQPKTEGQPNAEQPKPQQQSNPKNTPESGAPVADPQAAPDKPHGPKS